mgnify:CR=1 FL=1
MRSEKALPPLLLGPPTLRLAGAPAPDPSTLTCVITSPPVDEDEMDEDIDLEEVLKALSEEEEVEEEVCFQQCSWVELERE